MAPDDRALLDSVRDALSHPWRDPVRVCGQLMPRKLARQIERGFSRLALAHCPSCDLWLRPTDACLHIPPVPVPPAGSALDAHTPASSAQFFAPFLHASGDARACP